MLLFGEDEVIYDLEKVASRIRSVAPFITILAGAGPLFSALQCSLQHDVSSDVKKP
jgi:hypothetical protein